MTARRYSRRDWVVALALALVVFVLGLGQLTRGVPYWGDDSAGYISEGIAIARGELREQAERNLELHPSQLTDEAKDSDGLVYVWGFPLLLSLVYRCVGFDMEGYSNVICYKLPSLLCLALLAGVLYLFFRRRFSGGLAAAMALMLCLCADLMRCVDRVYGDVCFLFFSTLALLLLELMLDSLDGTRARASVALAVALGAALWYSCETRLNGITLCLVALLAQAAYLCGDRKRRAPAKLLCMLLPYLVFLALRALSERLLLPATPNTSDLGDLTPGRVLFNVAYYGYFSLDFLNSLTGFRFFAGIPLAILAVIGFVRTGFRRENLHLTALLVGTYVVDCLLPYTQRLRYVYGVLPVILIYVAAGWQWALERLARGEHAARVRTAARILGCALLACALLHPALACRANILRRGEPLKNEMYSAQSVEMYDYIKANIPEDAVIACVKPRALYLNTGRRSYHAGLNGHELLDADYYLCILSSEIAEQNLITDDIRPRFETLHETRDLTLYRILPE